MTREKVRLGIVGIGNMGSVHVKHVLDLANTELAALCDNREDKLAKANREAQVPVFHRLRADARFRRAGWRHHRHAAL